MIERVVLIKLEDDYLAADTVSAIAEHSREVLSGVPGVDRVRIMRPAEPVTEQAWDLQFVLQFASLEAVEEYRVHPDHRQYVDEYLRPRIAVIKAWNFEETSN
ncbi:MAG: hypothetical protein CMH54_05950 [Myxococcales bacterium]|nr:hypothetical protein [Myxococcales bacterium]|tara:strand:+ start:337 stop:645 length:309 start_codon:yes stop_codon:yes gene_type:complete